MNKLRIMVTGATGFVGQSLIPALLRRGHHVVCLARNEKRASSMSWYKDIEFISYDIGEDENPSGLFSNVDILLHLAWNDLLNYKSLDHLEKTLPSHMTFLHASIDAGIKQILITGTCLEYGMRNGELFESDACDPHVPYAVAKDTLRKYLTALQNEYKFNLQWVRLFYLFGNNQSERSLIPQLDYAIKQGDKSFNMSKGDQLRDFISINETVDNLCMIIQNSKFDGIVNCCTGIPVSVRAFVENRMSELNSNITLNLGFYPYPDYEPMAFWGSNKKLKKIIENV